MNTEKIIDIRFIAPVGIMVFFVFIFSPANFVEITSSFLSINWIASIVGVLGVGFIISSITHFLTRIFLGEPIGKYPHDLEKIFKLKQEDPPKTKNPIAATELAIWINLGLEEKESGKGVADQIHKRWNMAEANFNAAMAVFGGVAIAIILTLMNGGRLHFPSCYWFIAYFIFAFFLFCIFIFNGKKARKSVLDMGDLLATRNHQS
ncbi:MAG: hypothetical protein HYW89_04205 [Candidatus Sungiibacteriota bacterium]|uniref:Uncharacterized protein n=1 Tax=Candidatus Sungiibacteriota bacterium TaxID=2750080 RepID=A0A7T5RJ89_9BACT|nr:MAG: hypothetical protein HYW89_04205 [Candidatus Sungbacteria bacterium]